jgi:hypothetical protein
VLQKGNSSIIKDDIMGLQIIHELIPRRRDLLEMFSWSRRFIMRFKRTHHWALSWVRSIQATLPNYTALRYFLILCFYLAQVFQEIFSLAASHLCFIIICHAYAC